MNTSSRKKIQIIPAILPMDFDELTEKIDLIQGFTKTVQVDVCDGQFTRIPSWPYKKRDDNFETLLRQDKGLPAWQKIDYEFDLMVNKPEERAEQWIEVGAERIILHIESNGDVDKAIGQLTGKVKVGIAINMDTPIDDVEKYIGKIDVLQLMGISQIGFQGNPSNDKIYEKLRRARDKYNDLSISVDGGVTLANANELIKVGADRLVVGSAIFDSDNPLDAIQHFNRITSFNI